MERVFCKDKKGFCDCLKNCQKCEFAKGNGVISGYVAHDLLATLFGQDYDIDRLSEIARAEKEGRLLTLDLNTLLSIGAGLHAIINNKKLHCANYYTDLKKQFNGPYNINFLDAASILADIFYPKQEMLKALKEGENNG